MSKKVTKSSRKSGKFIASFACGERGNTSRTEHADCSHRCRNGADIHKGTKPLNSEMRHYTSNYGNFRDQARKMRGAINIGCTMSILFITTLRILRVLGDFAKAQSLKSHMTG